TVNVEAIQTQSFRNDFLQVDIDGFAIVSANLDGQSLIFAQDFGAVELSLTRYAVDFAQTLFDFVLDRRQVRTRVRTVSCLNRQFTDTLQVVVDFVQRTFSCLSNRDTVVGVTRSLSQAFDV